MSPVVGDELPQQPDVTPGDARQVRVPSDPRAAALPHVSASRIVGESLHEETRQKGIVERFLTELESGEIRPEKVGS